MEKLITIVLCALLSSFVFSDTIYFNDGGLRKSVVVTDETYSKVVYYFKEAGPGSKQEAAQNRIKEIQRADVPNDFQIAEGYFLQKAYKEARRDYERESQKRSWTQQHCLFRIAESYRLQKNTREAINSYNDVIRKFPKGRYLPEAHFYKGEVYFAVKDWRRAAGSYRKAAGFYQEIGKKNEEFNAKYKAAFCYEKKNDYRKAKAMYKSVVKDLDKDDKMYNKANVRVGTCLIGEKQYRDAKRHLLRIIDDKSMKDPFILSTAYVGLGDYYREGNAENDSKKSLFCYMRVILMYSGVKDDMVRAYKGAAICFKLMGNSNKSRQMEQQAARWESS
ncbi:tol-pal system YbgF family protein [Candidatus Uabimicrobium sp. HlEnr_7]|uniref:tetratricopeptide repeat protein n=1 Tax=Candidatus Uabimicrobium helgolandensis TaxID=3095367 RepID=UPI003557F61F